MIKKLLPVIIIFSSSALSETVSCPIIENKVTESIAACLATIEESAELTGAIVAVTSPVRKIKGRYAYTKAEREAADYKNEIIDNINLLVPKKIELFSSSKAQKGVDARYASLDLIVTRRPPPSSVPIAQEKKAGYGYIVQYFGGALRHHDDDSAIYKSIGLSAFKKIGGYQLGISLETAVDDKNMDLYFAHIAAQRPFQIGISHFNFVPGLFLGTIATKEEGAFDGGGSLALNYLISDNFALSLMARKGRFTSSIDLGVEVSL